MPIKDPSLYPTGPGQLELPIGVAARATVWGNALCPDCRRAAARLRAAGLEVEEVEAGFLPAAGRGDYGLLPEAEQLLALELGPAFLGQGSAFPVVTIEEGRGRAAAMTYREALERLGLEGGHDGEGEEGQRPR